MSQCNEIMSSWNEDQAVLFIYWRHEIEETRLVLCQWINWKKVRGGGKQKKPNKNVKRLRKKYLWGRAKELGIFSQKNSWGERGICLCESKRCYTEDMSQVFSVSKNREVVMCMRQTMGNSSWLFPETCNIWAVGQAASKSSRTTSCREGACVSLWILLFCPY